MNPPKDKHDLRNCPAMRALEHLTPGGSEYIDDIPRCVETVRYTRTTLHRLLIEKVKENKTLKAENEKLLAGIIELEIQEKINGTTRSEGQQSEKQSGASRVEGS